MDNRQTRRNALVPLREAIERYRQVISPSCIRTMADLYDVPVEHIEERLREASHA